MRSLAFFQTRFVEFDVMRNDLVGVALHRIPIRLENFDLAFSRTDVAKAIARRVDNRYRRFTITAAAQACR